MIKIVQNSNLFLRWGNSGVFLREYISPGFLTTNFQHWSSYNSESPDKTFCYAARFQLFRIVEKYPVKYCWYNIRFRLSFLKINTLTSKDMWNHSKELHSKQGYCQSLAHKSQRSNLVSSKILDSKIILLSTICREGE
jgi:hypothetical protein